MAAKATRAWLLLALSACTRGETHLVERVEVAEGAPEAAAALGLSKEQLRELLVGSLKGHGRFLLRQTRGEGRQGPVRLMLSVDRAWEEERPGKGRFALVGASLALRGETVRQSVDARAEAPASGESLDERQEAARRALSLALGQLVESAHLLLGRAGKSDPELRKELSSENPRARDLALRLLAERRDPAVIGALIQKLNGEELDQVRWAIGALVELKAQRAVPALIDLGRNQDPGFLRETIFALSEIGGEEAEAYLYTVAQGHDLPPIRSAAEQALDELRARKSKGEQAPGPTRKPKESRP